MDILAILQARVSSTRLPAKVLKDLLGRPMILRQIERIQRSSKIDHLVLATSVDSSDDLLYQICQKENIACFRGSLEDVLDRFYQIAKNFSPNHIVRLTGDCPFVDWQIIDQVISLHLESGSDYTSNCLPPTFPDGLDVEVFRFEKLQEAWKKASSNLEREHVTPYIRKNSNIIKNFCCHKDYSNLRWTVDEAEDFKLIEIVYNQLYPKNPTFLFSHILELMENNPELKAINNKFKRNEGTLKSLERDKKLGEKNYEL